MTNGEEYTFEVRAVSNANGAGAAASINATPQEGETAPGPMLGVDRTVTGVTGGSGGTVVFTWTDPDDDSIDKYQYRYDGSSSTPESWDRDWTDIPGTNNNKDLTTWSVGIHGTSTNVFYELRAVNDPTGDEFLPGPETAISVDRSNTPVSTPSPPDAPSIDSPTTSSEQVEVSWIYKNETQNTAITKQQHRQSEDGGDTWTDWTDLTSSAWADGTNEDGDRGFSHTFGSLTDGVAYTFEVRAVSTHGNGGPSTFTTTPGQPNPPFDLTVATADDTTTAEVNEDPTQTTLHLSWTAPIGGIAATGYDYRQRVSGAGEWDPWIIIQGDGTTTTFTAGGLAPGALYQFQVRAVAGDSRIPSDFAPTASGTTAKPPLPNKPENLVATGIIGGARLGWDRVTRGDPAIEDDTVSVYRYQTTTSAQVELSWDDPENTDITKWQYRQSETEAGRDTAEWKDIGSSVDSTTTHIVTGLSAGGTYFFAVRPYTTDGLDAVDIVGQETSGDFTGVTLWTALSNDDDAVEGTVRGLEDDAHYLRIQATNPGGDSPESDSVLATPKVPDNGTWTYQVVVSPNRILPDSGAKAEVSLVATWLAAAADRPEITTLSVDFEGSAFAEVDASDPPPQVVGFGTSSTGTLSTTSFAASPPGNCVTAIEAGTITCTLHITGGTTDLYAASGARGTYNVYVRPGSGFSLAAVVNGIETDASEPDDDDIPTGSLNVARPPTGGGGPTRDSVTANNLDETIDVTFEKPASVTLAVAVVDQACNAGAPDGSVHLCVEANASGAVQSLVTGPAIMTIEISPERWSSLRTAYAAGRFYVYKRSSPDSVWQEIPACQAGPNECYGVAENSDGSATITVSNITSFSQYAITTVGERTTATGGGVTTRPRRRARPTPTALPIPTVEATAIPDTPTPPPNTPTPPVEPTPPPPADTPTPPATVPPPEPPSPLPPTEAPVMEPTEPAPTAEPVVQAPATEAPPPPTEAPEVTAVPPPVDTGGGFPGWLIAVIIVAVIVVAGLGYLAFRMFRQQ